MKINSDISKKKLEAYSFLHNTTTQILTISSVNLTPAKITTRRLPTDTVSSQAAMIQDFIEGGDWE